MHLTIMTQCIKRLEWLTQSAGGAEERLWRLSELGGELTGGHEDALRSRVPCSRGDF